VSAAATRVAGVARTRLEAAVKVSGWKPVVSISILLAVLVLAGVAQSSPGRRVLDSVGLAAPAQSYTELYFASPSAPGVAVGSVSGLGGRQAVAFVIHNRSQAAVRYGWTVSSSIDGGADRGEVKVPSGGSATVTGQVVVACEAGASSREVQVRVSLTHPSESIDYWTQCHA
jgi:hypothetical protein